MNKNASKNVAEINEKINRINETLARHTTAVNMLMAEEKPGTMVSESPLALSEKGKKISESIDAEEIVNSRLDELRLFLNSLKIKGVLLQGVTGAKKRCGTTNRFFRRQAVSLPISPQPIAFQ